MNNSIQDFVSLVKKATTINRKSLTGNRGDGIICYNDDGSIKEINISSSFISKMFYKGEKRNYCPRKIFVQEIEKSILKSEPTESMLKGMYLECGLLGEGADGKVVDDLPRHAKTGNKLTDQKRIDQHFDDWEMRKDIHGIIVVKEGPMKNVQVRQKVQWTYSKNKSITVWVYGTADLISPFKDKGVNIEMACIDIKGTADITSTFGDYCWGNPEWIDTFQMILYNRIYGLPVLYLVFDWSKNVAFKPVLVNTNINHPDPVMANKASLRIIEMEQTVENCIDTLIEHDKNGWYANSNGGNCKNCNNYLCEEYGKIQEA